MTDTVGIGVVGAGMISQRGILPHLSQPDIGDRIRLHAVCDLAPGRAEGSAERYGIPAWYERYEDLLADPGVDMVTIATPIGLHYEQCKQALEAGKHVHANKTMTTTVAEADDLIETAAAAGLHIAASPGEVLRPQVTRIRELIAEGAIGNLGMGDLRHVARPLPRGRGGRRAQLRPRRDPHRPQLVLPASGRRTDVRRRRLPVASAHERARSGETGDGAVGHRGRPPRVPRKLDRGAGRRQHDAAARLRRGSPRGRTRHRGGHADRGLRRRPVLRHRGRDQGAVPERRAVRVPGARGDARCADLGLGDADARASPRHRSRTARSRSRPSSRTSCRSPSSCAPAGTPR